MNRKLDFRDICQLNVSALSKKVSDLREEDWFEDVSRQQTFHIHKSTQSIRLVDNIEPSEKKAIVHPFYKDFKQDIEPVLRAVKRDIDKRANAKKLEKVHGKSCFARVVLARLNEQAEIPRHNDSGPSLMYVHRVHCPLVTNDDCTFFVGKSERKLDVGELVEINNRRMHGVVNKGTEKRVHLIVDYYVPGEKIIDIDGNTHTCKL